MVNTVDLTFVRPTGSKAQRGTCNYHSRLSANRVTIIFGHKKRRHRSAARVLLLGDYCTKLVNINMLGLLASVSLDELTKCHLELNVLCTWFNFTCNLVPDWH